MRRAAIRAAGWWLTMTVVLAATAAWLGTSPQGIPWLDREGLVLAAAVRGPVLDTLFFAITWLGSLWVLTPIALVSCLDLWRRGHRGEAKFVMFALAGAAALAHLTKHQFVRPRPELFTTLSEAGSLFSFPSAHAAQATAVALASAAIVFRLAPGCRRWAMPALALIVALVDCSRVYLQVHYPSDVLAGTLAAVFWVAGLRAAMFAADTVPAHAPGT